MSRLVIVSNRLPVTPELDEHGGVTFVGSVGGLATGLGSFYQTYDSLWVGTCETEGLPCDFSTLGERLMAEHRCLPVELDGDDYQLYYEGFSNETIWPMFHHFSQYANFDHKTWDAYVRVNTRFCDSLASVLRQGDLVWINDYHLMLLPGMLRQRIPEVTVGFFLHIPFPSYEIFRMLPWRVEILEGLLGADVIGFHTYDYVRHFLSSVMRLTGRDHSFGEISVDSRSVTVDAFPMGIDYERFASAAHAAETLACAEELRTSVGERTFVLSVDRLDYTKGIPARLEAFAGFLTEHPEWHERVALTMVAVPSRTDVEHYQLLKSEVDELVGRINGEWGSMTWTPVRYLYRALPFHELVAMYREAEVMLVTPLRDGMNLVAKEYVATKGSSGHGVLVLSELAGAAAELGEAIFVNPFDAQALTRAILQALEMRRAEQRERLDMMQQRLKRYDVRRWAADFVGGLERSRSAAVEGVSVRLSPEMVETITTHHERAAKRLLLLDYDGTLVGFDAKPQATVPDADLLDLLRSLTAEPKNIVAVISGRDRTTLGQWLGEVPRLSLIAEHGALVRRPGEEWSAATLQPDRWKTSVSSVMETFVDRTPGSFVEEKETALVWHYRATDPELGPLRARELRHALGHLVENLDLTILEGNRVLEVKEAGITKGRATRELLENGDFDFVLGIGDDRTDEDIFEAMGDDAYTIKVGGGSSQARLRVQGVADVRELLRRLAR